MARPPVAATTLARFSAVSEREPASTTPASITDAWVVPLIRLTLAAAAMPMPVCCFLDLSVSLGGELFPSPEG